MRPVFITSLVAMLFFSRLVIADELRKVVGASGGATSLAPLAWDPPDAGRFSGGRNRASGSNLSVVFCLRSRGLVVAVGRPGVRSLHQLESGVTPAHFWIGWISGSRLALWGVLRWLA